MSENKKADPANPAQPEKANPGKKPILALNLTVKPRCRELEQTQLNVSHDQAQQLLQFAGAPDGTKISAKKGKVLQLKVRTAKGAEVNWIQGDTHAIWVQHQPEGLAREFASWIFENGGLKVDVLAAKYVEAAGETSGVEATASAEDCPF